MKCQRFSARKGHLVHGSRGQDVVRGTGMQVSPAPEPRDLVWHNVARPQAPRLALLGMDYGSKPCQNMQKPCENE